MEELEFLVERLGFNLVFDAAKAAAAMRSEMADAASAELAPAPNAQEVMAADLVKLTNDSAPPSRIDDYRHPGPPRRDWMQLPGRGAR